MKPGRSFNMSKQTKTLLGTLHGEKRSVVKKYMIQAEQAAAMIVRTRQPKQDSNNE